MIIVLFLCLKIFCTDKFCSKDSDCWAKSRPDIHSLYCVNNMCTKLLPPGRHCIKPTECASYFFYGPLACTAKCRVENECDTGIGKNIMSKYCCRSVPEGKDCINTRPQMLNGCDAKQMCLMDKQGEYKCESKNINFWIIGVILSISGNLMINVGLNFQKKSYSMEKVKFMNIELMLFHLGIMIYVLGKISGFTSYIFGNQSLLASLGAVGLIANSIFAPMINHEIFTWKDFLSIIFVLTGSSIIIMNSGRSHKVFSLCELLKMYKRKETMLWFIVIFVLIGTLFFAIKFFEVNGDWSIPNDFFNFLKKENVYYEEDGVILKYFMVLFYVGLSSIIASLTTLFAKSFGEMVDATISGDNQFLYGITYLFFIFLVFCTFLQIYWLNRALRHFDALLVIPVFHVIWTMFSVITAGIYFQDFEHYSVEQFKGFITGLLVIFLGSTFLASRVMNKGNICIKEVELEKQTVSKS
ncbi:NIPA-like magnesium transporter [Hamiltosporidium tvaerminnensis]|uniref:NIPA-like magnesium transporter n=2 Tax=Hamiltosporidium TaxID=1176354 RepID=A0A4Q9LB72_9MICR|nr:hypothetical protein LUQ84_001650 [Hamiltosporidium tvaerminnensis]TBU04281.1 NIPA-like magnesium transporter [Hamiltosporidium tvaerminnensis]TBU07436.1 NIPA-like magnesium transporter [Hamiltosporidium magnivora]TBU20912.1 NIPA-like magnesium transporter [Hamiltosporidium tvaerminnensis]